MDCIAMPPNVRPIANPDAVEEHSACTMQDISERLNALLSGQEAIHQSIRLLSSGAKRNDAHHLGGGLAELPGRVPESKDSHSGGEQPGATADFQSKSLVFPQENPKKLPSSCSTSSRMRRQLTRNLFRDEPDAVENIKGERNQGPTAAYTSAAPKVAHADNAELEVSPDFQGVACGTPSHNVGNPVKSKESRGRSAFNCLSTEDADKRQLITLLQHAEHLQDRMTNNPPTRMHVLYSTIVGDPETLMDSVSGILICLNAVLIGISMDVDDEYQDTVMAVDAMFSTAFLIELFIKIYMYGLRAMFCGKMGLSNWFDATIISFDVFQLILHLGVSMNNGRAPPLPPASLFRVVRLVRLVRIVRLLRNPAFDTLKMMLMGMMAGMPTLVWALMLFVVAIYIVSLVFREFFGREDVPHVQEQFSSVPRAMFTTFRCSFGDCSTRGGTPLFEHVGEHYGLSFSLFYCVFAFGVTIGVFNVISSIFIESTVSAGAEIKAEERKLRMMDVDLWASRVLAILRCVLSKSGKIEDDGQTSLSAIVDDMYGWDLNNADIVVGLATPAAKTALHDMDVDIQDAQDLAEILDPDQNGSITVIELIDGLQRIRGCPRRSDVVGIELMCRALTKRLIEVQEVLADMQAPSFSKQK
eukprot:TRINITY_DN36386_c0_g1_i1.p1 TRINITY_DN36386_c0_g1~~TRINITY_DN36386_c0_g1_i1.p1  ORF type:complete len:642 (+),score=85.25 TRINITY_DN36386_c0_g1_i1:74-1999(+)